VVVINVGVRPAVIVEGTPAAVAAPLTEIEEPVVLTGAEPVDSEPALFEIVADRA
jgi:hypothetical protein